MLVLNRTVLMLVVFASNPKRLFRRDMDGGLLTNAPHLVQIQSTGLLREMKGMNHRMAHEPKEKLASRKHYVLSLIHAHTVD